ncbi:zinc finger, c3HC4 type (RING finger) domain-containing protein [Phthorimaea operculella]|nr:zinc finger, c3HC4 type (RING finger) domain-containing protein [Phthorimaea operculella]
MEMLSAADDSSGANPSSVKSDDSSPRHESGRGSPPPKCAICLGTCRNKSFTDSCLHQFCFKCLLTWSKVKAECPLCKQVFKSIIHNVRSNHQYDEYTVEQRHEETTQTIDIDNLTQATRRFRYRTTLTLPRRETLAIQQLLMQHYPFMAEVFPPPAPRTAPTRRRRSPTTFRRTVYRHNLWARPLPDFTGRFRDCTPEFYRYNDSQMHRLVPWLNRELHYLLNENIGHISYVLTRILELLPQYHINSTEFKEALHRYFGDRTEHFLHELYCFASTPYDMTGYDRNVQYTTDSRISTMVNEVISSSESEASVDSDIVMVSSSHPAETSIPTSAPLPHPLPTLGAGPSRLPAPVYPQHYIPQPADNVIPIETISHSDTDDDDEVMVVGYIKPPQDRTPEVVDLLGSDSDVIVQDQEPASTETEHRSVPLVKLTLKRHRSQERNSESEDSTYQPPAPTRRKKRLRSNGTATTTDTNRSTPSPAPDLDWLSATESSIFTGHTPPSSDSMRTCSRESSRSESFFAGSTSSSDSSSDSPYERRKKLTKKKTKRKTRTESGEKEKKRKKRSSRSKRRERTTSKTVREEVDKSSGESGVSTPTTSVAASQTNDDQRPETRTPSPAMGESPYLSMEPQFPRYSEDTDSDDLPLNLSVQKTYTNL